MSPKIVGEIRQKLVECSICWEKLTITIYAGGKYKGGNCFRPVESKSAKDESWECDKCWGKPLIAIQTRFRPLD